jgi:hypothetical protein
MRKASNCLNVAMFLLGSVVLTGCSLSPAYKDAVTPGIESSSGSAIKGSVHGGQSAVVGAHIYLYSPGVGGYGTASTSLLNTSKAGVTADGSGNGYVTSDAGGNYSITGDYTCLIGGTQATATQVYLYAVGGTQGSVANSAATFMAAFPCPPQGTIYAGNLVVNLNEVSTVAAAYGLAGFATDATHIGSSGTTQALLGVGNGVQNAYNLFDYATSNGARTKTVAGNGVVPQIEINTLANILAACVNTAGAGSSGCMKLFANALNGSTMPTETATAAINMARNPSANVGTLFKLSTASSPFQPSMSTAPADFSITLTYSGANFSKPSGIAVDASGNVWIANVGNNVTQELTAAGAVSTYFNYAHLVNPYGIAIDTGGNLWFTTTGHVAADGGDYLYKIFLPGARPPTTT